MADGQTFTTKTPRVVQELWLTESKNRLKQKCKKVSMIALIFIDICERDYIYEWSFINICKLPIILHFCFYNLALNLSATTEGRPKDSLWFITDNRPFTIKHEALFLNWLLFVHHITVNLSYIPNFPENGDSSEFFHIQRGKVLWEVGGGSIRSLLSEWPSYSYNNCFKWFPNLKIQLISCIARLIIVFQLITFLVQDMRAGGSNYSLAHGQQICKSSFGDVSRQTTTL